MKRSWIGFFLLLTLLGAGCLAARNMEQTHTPIGEALRLAAESSLKNNWGMAALHTARARQEWENGAPVRAALTGHGPIEEIDALFAALETYGSRREAAAFAALAREMAQKIEAIGNAHSLDWKNML